MIKGNAAKMSEELFNLRSYSKSLKFQHDFRGIRTEKKNPILGLCESLVEGGASQQSMQLSPRWGAALTDYDWFENRVAGEVWEISPRFGC